MATGQEEDLDFAVMVWRDNGHWSVDQLSPRVAGTLDGLRKAVNAQASDSGAMAMVSVDEDFFIIVRSFNGREAILLSDASAAEDWPIAQDVLTALRINNIDDDTVTAGDPAIFADLGFSSAELIDLCREDDMYPDEILAEVATKLGFADEFDSILEQIA